MQRWADIMDERPRWADLADTSNEGCDPCSPMPSMLVRDDSYCETPPAELMEGARNGGLMGRMSRLGGGGMEPPQPKNITFLLSEALDPPSERRDSTDVQMGRSSAQLSAEAPAFAPMEFGKQQSFAAPMDFSAIFGIVNSGNTNSSSSATGVKPQLETAKPLQLHLHLQPLLPPPSSLPPRRRVMGKRSKENSQVPPVPSGQGGSKRVRGECGRTLRRRSDHSYDNNGGGSTSSLLGSTRVAPARAEFSVTAAAAAAAAAVEATPTPVAAAVPAVALPEATEEDWQRRLQKRLNAVAATKATAEYVAYSELRARGELPTAHLSGVVAGEEDVGSPAPRTPVPTDRTISKRGWEDRVRQWRASLRELCPVAETNVAANNQEVSPTNEDD